jgi:glutathione S-transferase
MSITLYDLAGADEHRRFSPYCWRTKMALAHKGLAFTTVPWRYADKAVIAAFGSDRVPVIVDNGRPVKDSWTIANYLEDTYPDQPSLFGGNGGRAVARFVNSWTDTAFHGALVRFIALDILDHLAPGDRAYFRETREQRLGGRLEDVVAGREDRLPAFHQLLEPLRQALAAQPFIGGDTPLYPDYIIFGSLNFARAISPLRLIEPSDPVDAWRQRLLDSFDGLARSAPGYW